MRKNGIIILISGLSGSKRSVLAKQMETHFQILKIISLDDYCNENNVPIIEIFDQKIKDWDDIVVYDWDKFNKDVKQNKEKGCIVYGDIFPKTKLSFEPDFHIHITISKEKLIEKRREFIEKNPEKCKEMVIFLDKLGAFINKVTYAHYIKNRQDSKIDLWLKSDENTLDEMYNQSFDYLMDKMKKFLNEYYSIHERKFDFIKDKKKDKDKEEEEEEEEEEKKLSSDVSNDDSDSDDDGEDDSDTDSVTDTDTSEDNYQNEFDEVDKEYNYENAGNISLGKYNDLVQEAYFTNG